MKDKDIDALSADAAQDRPADDWADVKYSVREYIWYHANVTPQKAQDIADGIDRWYKKRAEAAQSPAPAATGTPSTVTNVARIMAARSTPQPDTEALRLALEKALSEDDGTGAIAEEAARLAPKISAALAASPPAAGQPEPGTVRLTVTSDARYSEPSATIAARFTPPAGAAAGQPTAEERAAFKQREWERVADLHPGVATAGAAERLDVERLAWDVWEYVIDSLQPQWKDARVAEEWGKALRAYIVARLSEQADR
jgi:hypothetical protein